jgi:hypothetical protein
VSINPLNTKNNFAANGFFVWYEIVIELRGLQRLSKNAAPTRAENESEEVMAPRTDEEQAFDLLSRFGISNTKTGKEKTGCLKTKLKRGFLQRTLTPTAMGRVVSMIRLQPASPPRR